MAVYQIVLIVLFVTVAPFLLGGYLTKRLRMPDYYSKITLVLFTLFFGTAICVFGWKNIKLGIDLRGGVILVYQLVEGEESVFAQPGDQAATGRRARGRTADVNMDELVQALRKRVDPGGIKEVTIRPLGSRQVEIIIPEVDQEEVDRIRAILGSIGTLEFRILATTRKPEYANYIERAKLLPENETNLLDAEGARLAFWVPVAPDSDETGRFAGDPTLATRWVTRRQEKQLQVLVISDAYEVTGDYLYRASPGADQRGRPAVNFSFGAAGAQRFGALTGSHLPNELEDFYYLLGIILDGKLQRAPRINSTIFDRGIIEGYSTEKEVQKVVDILNAGKLPAALSQKPISQQYIGPTLGRDTIQQGLQSLVIALLLVFVFAIVYYRVAGVVACFALVMNGILLLAIMIAIKAAFSLPGLAGFALTMAMAVDANVLIYERMREEAHRGAALRMTIRNGFERALSAIVDSNLTTLITAVVLYTIGTDQVRGFAVTLFLGIVLSMYTAIFVARVIFDIAERQRWISSVKMLQAIGETRINFLGHKWVMIGISSAMIVVGMVGVVHRGRGLLDIDFTGGISVQVVFDEFHDIRDVRRTLEEARLPDVVVSDVQSQEASASPGTQFMINTSTPPDQDAEEYLRDVQKRLNDEIFKGELSHNGVEISKVAPAVLEAPSPPPAPAGGGPAAEKPAQPQPGQQTRLGAAPGLGPDAGVLSSLLLGKAPDEAPKVPAPAVGGEAPKPAAPPKEAAAAVPARPATQATLTFVYPLSYNAVETILRNAAQTVLGAGRSVDFALSNPSYEDGSIAAYSEWTLRLMLPENQAKAVLAEVERNVAQDPVFPQSNTIGGAVAQITRYRAIYALLASTLFILLYLWVRFQRISYGLGAVASLVHDVLLALGFVALSYYLAQIPGVTKFFLIEPFKVNLTVTTALLTLAGYSLNDTIVVFDRIREVRGKAPRVTQDMINLSINQTLSRTILTGLIAFMIVVMLYILGGPTIHGFAFAMLVGVVTGMYSSIYIASPFLLWIAGSPERR